jgi:signal transduction histidine kinase
VFNLLRNGGEAMPEGGRLEVRTRHDETSNEAVIEVEDEGEGICRTTPSVA